ncbi:4-alpha-glucanotransferase [Uliginosibacterium aquaticum]|uniref:4-alpha-glucanotransferase n=1 Tax=Uliginosibacterium aquaticum TaxID=2731212 RepID=A0ABX2IDV2_9RHOO|nr:4-alpha-glucanotransferase [Uliginosibacterium aquaticum]NSL54678.1 4-alpha-glucanotransferase [Uliginosibacterium aquaticum]
MRFPRASGILLHPTSLPGPHGSGDLGIEARHFVDWLAASGQSLWQILPLGGIGPGNSPYMSSSAFAGNVLLIDLAELQAQGWLPATLTPDPAFSGTAIHFSAVVPWRMARLQEAATCFFLSASSQARQNYANFCAAQAGWLDDYALFMALADHYGWQDWCDWPAPLARREPAALNEARQQHAERINFWKFCQCAFFRQWHSLKTYAHSKGIQIIGDAPIFIAYQSAEVWARPDLFELDTDGKPQVVAGVPPDAFTAEGQRWGNPLYRWSAHAAEHYAWWITRIRRTFELVDIVRIDHFRGFVDYWEIPASEPNAIKGRWLAGPGAALFEAISAALGPLPIIAEDLGILTPAVDALRQQLGLPGMRILHFAFGSQGEERSANAYLPHNYSPDTVVYTGTHDNDTTRGWWAEISEAERQHVRDYLAIDGADIHWSLIRAACASVADTAIHPLQDVLGLGTEARMNFPGKAEGYWQWRFEWAQLQPRHGELLASLCRLYRR